MSNEKFSPAFHIGYRVLPGALRVNPRVDRDHMVVDLENLCGGSEGVSRLSQAAYRAISKEVRLDRAQLVVAVGVHAWRTSPNLGFQWPNARFLVGRGLDGADLRLLEDLLEEPAACRSARVIIASGDGRFAPAAQMLSDIGVHVTALSLPGSMSRRLKDAVHEVRYLPLLAL